MNKIGRQDAKPFASKLQNNKCFFPSTVFNIYVQHIRFAHQYTNLTCILQHRWKNMDLVDPADAEIFVEVHQLKICHSRFVRLICIFSVVLVIFLKKYFSKDIFSLIFLSHIYCKYILIEICIFVKEMASRNSSPRCGSQKLQQWCLKPAQSCHAKKA